MISKLFIILEILVLELKTIVSNTFKCFGVSKIWNDIIDIKISIQVL